MDNNKKTSRKTATAAKAQQADSASPSPAKTLTEAEKQPEQPENQPKMNDDLQTNIKDLIQKLDVFFVENAALRKRNDELAACIESLERLLAEKHEPFTAISSPAT